MKQIKYRICENAYGWFKVQRYCYGIFFGGKWKDINYWLYETKEDAVNHIKSLVQEDQRTNEEWKCHETYI